MLTFTGLGVRDLLDGIRHVILAIWISSLGGMVEGSGDVDAGWPAHQIVKITCLTHLAFSYQQLDEIGGRNGFAFFGD